MHGRPMVLLVAGFGLLIAACGDATSPVTPTTAPPAAIATAPAVSASPTPAAQSAATATVAAPAASPTAAPTASPAVSPAAAGALRLELVAEETEARYRVREQLANRSLPSDAVGTTQDVTGSIVVDQNGAIVADRSKIVVDLSTLTSDESRRDNFIRNNTLQTNTYPRAEFVPREARGLPWPLPTSGQATFQLVGDLTIHGETRPATWETEATFQDQELTGTARTSIKITDFGMEIPRVAVVLSIEDEARLEIDFHIRRETDAAGVGTAGVASAGVRASP